MPRKIQCYGWIPDLPDHRDQLFFSPLARVVGALPVQTDLRAQCPPVYNQGQLGSCTANAIAGDMQFLRMKEKLAPDYVPSRLFIYYNERVIEGTIDTDSGASLRDGIDTIARLGACSESLWPYDAAKFAVQPPAGDYTAALADRELTRASIVQSIDDMIACLAEGYPFVFGFTVYESFESAAVAASGIVPMPGPNEAVIGGHAVMAVGSDTEAQTFLIRNSWGADWGMAGYCTMPFDYLDNAGLSSSFWSVRLVGA
jgi:C1A family cysteine protease